MLVTKIIISNSKIRIIDQQTKKLIILIAITNYSCYPIRYFKRRYTVRCLLIRIKLFSTSQIVKISVYELNKTGNYKEQFRRIKTYPLCLKIDYHLSTSSLLPLSIGASSFIDIGTSAAASISTFFSSAAVTLAVADNVCCPSSPSYGVS